MFSRTAVLCTALMLAACGPKEPIDPFRVAANRAVIEKCRAMADMCAAGLVKWRNQSKILRIINQNNEDCDLCIHRSKLLGITTDTELNQIEYIVLPRDQPKWWETAATLYMWQYRGEQ